MKKVRLTFQEIPEGFQDTYGQSFEVDDLDAFLAAQSDVIKSPLIRDNGKSLFYVSGNDAEGFSIWKRASIQQL